MKYLAFKCEIYLDCSDWVRGLSGRGVIYSK